MNSRGKHVRPLVSGFAACCLVFAYPHYRDGGWCGAANAQVPNPPEKSAASGPDPVGSHFYGDVGFLNWWVKDAPLSVPLISTGPIATTHHGLLGPPATNGADSTVLYGAPHSPAQGGSDSQSFGGTPGIKATVGYWLDDAHRSAVEVGGFVLRSLSAGYSAEGDATGNPVLGIPVHNSTPYSVGTMTIFPGEDSLPFSLPDDTDRARSNGIITGGINIRNTLNLWGADVKGTVQLYRNPTWDLFALAGFRHVNLSESFNLTTNIQGVSGPFTGQSGVARDIFKTGNQFYGATIGLRGGVHAGPWFAQVTTQLAPGISHQAISVAGGYTSANFGPTSGPEGVFAQPANEGRTTSNKFAFVADNEIKIGYELNSHVRIAVGYEVLYYSSVVRPTDQIDRNVPKGQTFLQAAPTISTTSPAKLFNATDFYAQGINVGVEVLF